MSAQLNVWKDRTFDSSIGYVLAIANA